MYQLGKTCPIPENLVAAKVTAINKYLTGNSNCKLVQPLEYQRANVFPLALIKMKFYNFRGTNCPNIQPQFCCQIPVLPYGFKEL